VKVGLRTRIRRRTNAEIVSGDRTPEIPDPDAHTLRDILGDLWDRLSEPVRWMWEAVSSE
jgi:hypothetical protein